jgi:hypothetical protein
VLVFYGLFKMNAYAVTVVATVTVDLKIDAESEQEAQQLTESMQHEDILAQAEGMVIEHVSDMCPDHDIELIGPSEVDPVGEFNV